MAFPSQLRPVRHALLLAVLILTLVVPARSAQALALADLPASPPAERVIDTADVLSRAGRSEIEQKLERFAADHVDARLITVKRLDYGVSLDSLGRQLLQRWTPDPAEGRLSGDPLLFLLIDAQTRGTAIVASPPLERQLPPELLRSTARTTMAQPLKEGDRYRQATLDALARLDVVIDGGEDPGEPDVPEAPAVVTNIPSQEDTASSNAFTWVVVLLVVGSVVPMLTWWVFSR
ncbi:TPM domain-containing protein [Cyanobium sp. FGCU-6]|nr:TPM domain-containing protein [Cyanobium sp. FGCU6]